MSEYSALVNIEGTTSLLCVFTEGQRAKPEEFVDRRQRNWDQGDIETIRKSTSNQNCRQLTSPFWLTVLGRPPVTLCGPL